MLTRESDSSNSVNETISKHYKLMEKHKRQTAQAKQEAKDMKKKDTIFEIFKQLFWCT